MSCRKLTPILVGFIFCVMAGSSLATESLNWDQLLTKAAKSQGDVWCGIANGKLQLGSKALNLFAYQIVTPGQKDFVLHLWAPQLMEEAATTDSYFLRITSNRAGVMIQDGPDPPRPFSSSVALARGQQLGFVFGLPDYLTPGTEMSAVSLSKGESPGTIQVSTPKVSILFPGVEGRFKLVLDEVKGFPIKLVTFGLDEWQGVPRGGFKLLIKFQTYPECRLSS